MGRKMSAKVKWAVGLLIAWLVIGFGNVINGNDVALEFPVYVLLNYIILSLPGIAAIITNHYDYRYTAPKRGNWSLLRKWTIALIAIGPISTILSYIALGYFDSIVWIWIVSCILPGISILLLCLDTKAKQNATAEIQIESTLISLNVFYFNQNDVKNLYETSTVDDSLDSISLQMNIKKFYDSIKDKQQQVLDLYNSNPITKIYPKECLIKVCRFARSKDAKTDVIKDYIENMSAYH